jgi:NAD(P)-dependent dehydrogenase (short-subunit alcohol dehydrogenase family)
MRERRWGHIINMSPPIDLKFAPGRVAYCISKFGMTLLTYGLAEEVRADRIAVNSLWPVTIVESQASINMQLGSREHWRKPDLDVSAWRQQRNRRARESHARTRQQRWRQKARQEPLRKAR